MQFWHTFCRRETRKIHKYDLYPCGKCFAFRSKCSKPVCHNVACLYDYELVYVHSAYWLYRMAFNSIKLNCIEEKPYFYETPPSPHAQWDIHVLTTYLGQGDYVFGSVCLFVCLCVCMLATLLKKLWEVMKSVCQLVQFYGGSRVANEQVIKFWWWYGHYQALVEVCALWVLRIWWLSLYGYLVAKECYWVADTPDCKSGQYGGNELPYQRSMLSECSCL